MALTIQPNYETAEIPRFDRAPLSLMCGIEESVVLPPEVVLQYWRARRIFGRVAGGGPLPPAVLVQIGLCSGLGYTLPTDAKPITFEDRIRDGKVKRNDRIVIEWRGKPTEVTFLQMGSDRRVKFLMDGKKGEMTIEMAKASLKSDEVEMDEPEDKPKAKAKEKEFEYSEEEVPI